MVHLWSLPSAANIYKDEDVKALYKGLAARLYRLSPGGGIMIVEFDIVADYFYKNKLFWMFKKFYKTLIHIHV